MKTFGLKMGAPLFLICSLCGCTWEKDHAILQKANQPVTMYARYTETPITLDGKLDEPVWRNAAVYKMFLPADRAANGQLQEGGEVRLAWDDEYFYVGIKFDDSDIVAEGTDDQLQHYQLGDLCELFLKPNDKTWYWELYVTPRGNKTSFWFPSQGRLGLPSNFEYECGLKVAAQYDGKLNDWQDRDRFWTAEMAMPIKDLTGRGEEFGPGADWRILVARYNYSYYLSGRGPELSSSPGLSATNFHLLKEYAVLRLLK